MNDKDFLKQLGLRLKCQRIMTELSVKEVSDKSGLAAATINKMERGAQDFHILNLKRIAATYGVAVKELL